METRNNNINNNENEKNVGNYSENKNINQDSENYIIDFDGIFQKLLKHNKKGKNRENEYYCNLIMHFADLTPVGKIEIIKLLYIFNSNPKDKNYKYYIFKELYNTIDHLNQNETLELNFNQLIEILLEQGKFYKQEGNLFYSYYYLYNILYRDKPNIKNLRSNVKDEMIDLNEQKKKQFKQLDDKAYKELLNNLKNAIYNKTKRNPNEILYAINKAWLKRAIDFINYILNSEEYEKEKRIENSFTLYNVYEYYFNFNKENNLYPYPGKIDNYKITDFNDIWMDPINDDENYLLKQNITVEKDYKLVLEKDWNIFKDLFGATNIIKRKINSLDLIKLKVIILDKKIYKMKSLNLLCPKYIQTKKDITIKEFKEKIIRCVNYTLKNNELENELINKEENIANFDEKNTCDEDINMDDLTNSKMNENNNDNNENEIMNNINIYQNMNISIDDNRMKEDISFYKLNKENKELLIEIFTAFINEIPKYETIYIKKIVVKDDKPLESLFNSYDEFKDILIIEKKINNSNSFLFAKEHNEKGLFQCSICNKWETVGNKYNCPKCNLSFYCSKKCSESSINDYHIKLHYYLKDLQIKNINNNFKYNNYNLVGLMNLGNTCFINSTLQCLFNTSDLSNYFLQNDYKKEINIQNKQGYKGEIVEAFAILLKKAKTSNVSRINPIDFLRVFFTKNKSLNLRSQQDAQEFLSILLDCLHEDLNRITNKPYILLEEQKPTETDLEASKRFWDLYKKRENSIIVDLFHGQFKSKITCLSCNKSSITYEPFIFLGLPIPQKHNQEIIKFFFANKWEYFGFELKEKSTIFDLKQKAINHMKMCGYKINESNDELYNIIELVQFDKYKIIKNIYNENNIQINDKELLSNILNKDIEIVLYERKIEKEYFNIYAYPIKGDDYDTSSYPISISVNKDMTLKDAIENNKENILKMYINPNKNEKIKIGLLHKKNNGWIYYITNMFESKELCPLCQSTDENFCDFNNEFLKIDYIFKTLKNYKPILFVVGFTKRKLVNREIKIPGKINNGLFFLNDCLKLFCEEELLNSDNMWYCNNCKKHKTAKKQIRLFKLPQYLIIQLKKFKNNSGFFYSSNEKKDIFIKYPLNNLDLNKYVEDKEGNKQKYDLYAVIQHHGEISEGHYTAICKINDIWVLFNDSLLSKINNPVTNDAYLLFYRRSENNF